MRGGFRSGAQQQKEHRDHFVGADAPTFHLNAHEIGYQPLSSMLAREPKSLLEVAFYPPKAAYHAQDAGRAGEPRHRVGPGDEFRPVGRRQAEQLADDRERQDSGIALDEIGRTPIGE